MFPSMELINSNGVFTSMETRRHYRVFGLVLAFSCFALFACVSDPSTSNEEGLEDIETSSDQQGNAEFNSQEDMAPPEVIEDDVTLVPDETNEAHSDNDEVEDFALDDYKPFDPGNIVLKFEFESYELTPSLKADLDRIVEGMEKDILVHIVVKGHADKQGPDSFNQWLSQKRARAIESYLIDKGISEKRLRSIHFGSSKPVVDQPTVKAYKQNRRGDFELDYGNGSFGQIEQDSH